MSLSAHAGNHEVISLDWLRDRGWLENIDIHLSRNTLLYEAYQQFMVKAEKSCHERFLEFRQSAEWLYDYALFMVIRACQANRSWTQWPDPLRDRHIDVLDAFVQEHETDINVQCFIQFVFFQQWQELKQYAAKHSVKLFGDMPLFVSLDSADVWAQRELFTIDPQGRPEVVAGTPPDYFSEQGQRWGNPLFRWNRMQADQFAWWRLRMKTQLQLYDVVRIDHFRGLEACWEIPAHAKTAAEGQWVKVPGDELLRVLQSAYPELPLIAEDLGTITSEVVQLRQQFGLPGMRVLQFGFDGDPDNPHAPHNCDAESVVYTGTHDNNTACGWFESLGAEERDRALSYLAYPAQEMPWPWIKCALSSVAKWAIIPIQDLLGLGAEARVNTPGTMAGNWQWRFEWAQLDPGMPANIRVLLQQYGRV